MSFSSPADVQEDCRQLYEARKTKLPRISLSPDLCPLDLYHEAEMIRAKGYIERFAHMDSERKCQPEDLVVHAGDDPLRYPCWSATSGKMPCIRKSCGLFFAVAHRRHLLMKELYLSMGYPVFPEVARHAGVQLYRLFTGPRVSYFSHTQALGNSMCVPQIGVTGCVLMLCAHIQNAHKQPANAKAP